MHLVHRRVAESQRSTSYEFVLRRETMFPRLRTYLPITMLLSIFVIPVHAQGPARNISKPESTGSSTTKTEAKTAPVDPRYTTPKSPLDTAYGAKIAEYTTEKYF